MKGPLRVALLLAIAWVIMLTTHELGHIIGGKCCGGTLQSYDLLPWHLPYSNFEPDPYPLITLWSGPLLGVILPTAVSIIIRTSTTLFIASFCTLANGLYISTAWFSGERYLDTPKLLAAGASPASIASYCLPTIGIGYVVFRRNCIECYAAE